MQSMLPAKSAVFFKLKFIRCCPFILCCRIISSLALCTGKGNIYSHQHSSTLSNLFNNFTDNAGADRTAAFTDRKPKLLLHGNRGISSAVIVTLSPGHDHLNSFRQRQYPCYIRRSEIKLRPITGEKRRMTTTFFFAQYVHLCLELRVRRDRFRASLQPGHAQLLHASCPAARSLHCLRPDLRPRSFRNISTPVHTVLAVSRDPYNLYFFTDLDNTTFNSTRYNRPTTGYAEYILYRHQERLVDVSLRLRNI